MSRENAPLTYQSLDMTAKSASCEHRCYTSAMNIALVMTVKGYAKQCEKRCAGLPCYGTKEIATAYLRRSRSLSHKAKREKADRIGRVFARADCPLQAPP